MASSINHKRSTYRGLTKGGSLPRLGLRPSRALREAAADSTALRTSLNPDGSGPAKALATPGWKRVLDISCVVLTSPVWLPLMILIGAWIKAFSTGPLIFKQSRIGLGTKPFTILKFRTMKVGAETRTHENHFKSLVQNGVPMTKLDTYRDHRVITGGRLLRATGLDELPQLFNVLRGEMSLVGPRPCTPNELEHYSDSQKSRFDVPPGITGYWQVKGKNSTTFNQMIEMDTHYGKRMSPLRDLAILVVTIPALVSQAIESRRQAARREAVQVPMSSDTIRLG